MISYKNSIRKLKTVVPIEKTTPYLESGNFIVSVSKALLNLSLELCYQTAGWGSNPVLWHSLLVARRAARTRKCLFCVAWQLEHFLRTFLSRQLCSVPLLCVRGDLAGFSYRRWRIGAANAIATAGLWGGTEEGAGSRKKGGCAQAM